MEYLSSYSSLSKDPKKLGVIVLQEWWGLDEHIKSITVRFASNGYNAIAPDLYHGVVTKEPDEAKKLMMAKSFEEAFNEIEQSIDFLKSYCEKVYIAGFCMGGFLSLKASEHFKLDGTFAFYPGGYDPTVEEISKYNAPVDIFYGTADEGYDKEKYEKITQVFKEKDKKFELHLFDRLGHAFMNPARDVYNSEGEEAAWKIVFSKLEGK